MWRAWGGEKCLHFGGKPEGRRPLVRPRCRWEDNIGMDLGEMALGIWIQFIWLWIGTGGEL
jgi:hypothetical protein